MAASLSQGCNFEPPQAETMMPCATAWLLMSSRTKK
jgi:hypothetical protein